MNTNVEHSYANRAAVENLGDRILLEIADYYIVVCNELVWNTQMYISKVAEEFLSMEKQNQAIRKLIVIHNWINSTAEEVEVNFEKYIKPNYIGRKVNIQGSNNFYFNVKQRVNEVDVYIDHFFMVGEGATKDGAFDYFINERKYNQTIINVLKQNFAIWFPPCEFNKPLDVENTILEILNNVGRDYYFASQCINNHNNNNNCNIGDEDGDDDYDFKYFYGNSNLVENSQSLHPELPIPVFTFESGAFKIRKVPGVKYLPRIVPMKEIQQFHSEYIYPIITYYKPNEEMICQIECPGCDVQQSLVLQVACKLRYFSFQSTVSVAKLEVYETESHSENNVPDSKVESIIKAKCKESFNLNTSLVIYEGSKYLNDNCNIL